MVEGSKDFELEPKKDRAGGRTKKSVFTWNLSDVLRWLQKYHQMYYTLYGDLFKSNDIIGKVLVQLTTHQLEQMGVNKEEHRIDLIEKIIKLRLRHEQVELKLLLKTPQTPKGS